MLQRGLKKKPCCFIFSIPQLGEGVGGLHHHGETVLTLTKALNLAMYGPSAKQGIDPP